MSPRTQSFHQSRILTEAESKVGRGPRTFQTPPIPRKRKFAKVTHISRSLAHLLSNFCRQEWQHARQGCHICFCAPTSNINCLLISQLPLFVSASETYLKDRLNTNVVILFWGILLTAGEPPCVVKLRSFFVASETPKASKELSQV